MARGGYQRPNNPSPISGPGRFSSRTDGSVNNPAPPLTDAPSERYGERASRERAIRQMPDEGTMGSGASGASGESNSGSPSSPGAASGAGGVASTPSSAAGAGPPPNLAEAIFAPGPENRRTPAGGPSHRRQMAKARRVIHENQYALLEEIYRRDANNDVLELLQRQRGRGMQYADEFPRMAQQGYRPSAGATSMDEIDPRFRLDLGDPSVTWGEDYNNLDESEVTPGLSEQEADRLELGHAQANLDYLTGNPFAYHPASVIRAVTGLDGEQRNRSEEEASEEASESNNEDEE